MEWFSTLLRPAFTLGMPVTVTGEVVTEQDDDDDDEAADERPQEPLRVGLLTALLPTAVFLVIGVPLAIRTLVVEAFETEGPSMAPTLLSGERFAVDRMAYGLLLPFASAQSVTWRQPALGDVVVVRSTQGNVDIIKRVVGVPGDLIECSGYDVRRNGEKLAQEQVLCSARVPSGPTGRRCYRERLGEHLYVVVYDRELGTALPLRVPAGHVYLLGDNRTSSNDSRNPAISAVSTLRIKGRASRTYWSPHDLSRILQVIE